MTNVLYLYGGWPGHNPYGVATWARKIFDELGFDVEESNDVFTLDRDLSGYDLIANNWNNGLLAEALTPSQEAHLLGAVESGTGFAAWHGAGAAFRLSVKYHWLLGADVLDHPAGEGVRHPYQVSIVDREHEVTRGVSDISVASEQYYMNVDPRAHVLADTVFDGEHMPWIAGTRMPQVWTNNWGDGRVFYSAIGHYLEDLEDPDVTRLMKQGFAWAARASEDS
ncbi:MAG TPA: ThuA domain-containing protein [Microbacterium sp.]|nr:ThuA domain-containing protein [Microbacterium sp.]